MIKLIKSKLTKYRLKKIKLSNLPKGQTHHQTQAHATAESLVSTQRYLLLITESLLFYATCGILGTTCGRHF